MLDTSICVEAIRRRDLGLVSRLGRLDPGSGCLSAVSLAELEFGASKSSNSLKNRVALLKFCSGLEILPFDKGAAADYGSLRAELEGRGQGIGPLDTLIAAHALSLSAVLVTRNVKEFRRIPNLVVESWS